jgi:predicted enzyme related to lactoylglutathione lyase
MADQCPVFELRVVLTVEDVDKALAFYGEALGLPVMRSFQEGRDRGVLLAAGKATVELLSRGTADAVDRIEIGRATAAPVRMALEVGDAPAVSERLEAAGGEKLGKVVDTPWGHRNVRLVAPGGLQVTLFTVMEEPA